VSDVLHCGTCGDALEKPGDYCLVCRSPNADGVVVEVAPDRATLTMLDGESVVGESTVTTTPEPDPELERTGRRNFVGRVVDEVRRKRPEAVYMAGERDALAELRGELHYDCYRVDEAAPVQAAIERRGERDLEVIEAAPEEKLRGSHSTLVGGRTGRRAVLLVAGHPHVKAVIPGPIETGGRSGRGATAKVTRADDGGNLRMLIRDGSTVQENRVVTTAMNREMGERVRDDLNELLAEEGLG
jgi:hypothetical protein